MSTTHETTREAVRERLDRVTDPELDESIVDLNYIDSIEFEDGTVTVRFTLPTAWCSPAFAWMMAVDARDEVESLPSVRRARIVLQEHLHDEEINSGVNDRLSFDETFPDADGDIDAVRADLDEKTCLARQYDAVEALLEAGLDGETIAALRVEDVESDPSAPEAKAGEDRSYVVYCQHGTVGVSVPAEPIDRYLEKAHMTGRVSDSSDRCFTTPDRKPIDESTFDLVHRRARSARINMSSQGGICDELRKSRERRLETHADD